MGEGVGKLSDMVAQSRRRASVLPVSVDRRWDWLLGQVCIVLLKTYNVRLVYMQVPSLKCVRDFT